MNRAVANSRFGFQFWSAAEVFTARSTVRARFRPLHGNVRAAWPASFEVSRRHASSHSGTEVRCYHCDWLLYDTFLANLAGCPI